MHITVKGSPVAQSQAQEKNAKKIRERAQRKELAVSATTMVRKRKTKPYSKVKKAPKVVAASSKLNPMFALGVICCCMLGFIAGCFGLSHLMPTVLTMVGVL